MLNQPQKLTVVGTQHCCYQILLNTSNLTRKSKHMDQYRRKTVWPGLNPNNFNQKKKKVLGTQGVEITHPFLESIRHSTPMKQSYLPIAVTPHQY
jgi:hypothetical protein